MTNNIVDFTMLYEPQRQHTAVVRIYDNKITYYYHPSGGWQKDDFSFDASGPTMGPISACFEQQRNHTSFFIKGADGYLHFWFTAPGWTHDWLSFQPAGQVTGDISAFFNPRSNHAAVFFKGGDGKLHYYSVVNGTWNHEYLAFDAAGQIGHLDACFDPHANGAVCFAVGADGSLHCFREQADGTWTDDVTALSAGAGPVTGKIAAVYEPLRENVACFAVCSPSKAVYCYYTTAWCFDNTSLALEDVDGGIDAVFSVRRNHSECVFRSAGGNLQYYFVENGTWQSEKDLCKIISSSPYVHMDYEDIKQHCAICYLGTDDKIHYLYGQPPV